MIAVQTENIELIESADKAHAIAALTMAFANDPAVRWLFPEARQYLRHFPNFARAFAVMRTVSDRADDAAHVDFPRFVNEVASGLTRRIVRAPFA